MSSIQSSPEVNPMFQYHPALVKALQQDRYYRLVNERRRCNTSEPLTCPTASPTRLADVHVAASRQRPARRAGQSGLARQRRSGGRCRGRGAARRARPGAAPRCVRPCPASGSRAWRSTARSHRGSGGRRRRPCRCASPRSARPATEDRRRRFRCSHHAAVAAVAEEPDRELGDARRRLGQRLGRRCARQASQARHRPRPTDDRQFRPMSSQSVSSSFRSANGPTSSSRSGRARSRSATARAGRATVTLDGDKADEWDIAQLGDSITIDRHGSRAKSMRIFVEAPPRTDVEVKTVSADVTLGRRRSGSDEFTRCRATSESTRCATRRQRRFGRRAREVSVAGDASLTTVSGDIDVARHRRTAAANSASGDIRISSSATT